MKSLESREIPYKLMTSLGFPTNKLQAAPVIIVICIIYVLNSLSMFLVGCCMAQIAVLRDDIGLHDAD